MSESGTVVVDERQRLPESWDVLRRSVDEDPPAGRFLLTGSASLSVPSTHTGAGRIVSVRMRMRPLALPERWDATLFRMPTVSLADLLGGSRPGIGGRTDAGFEDYTREIVRGGFPGLRNLSARARRAALSGYIGRIIDRDFPEAGHRMGQHGSDRGVTVRELARRAPHGSAWVSDS